MCEITVIYKNASGSKDEFVVSIDKGKVPSLETPYYVVAQILGRNLLLEFYYAQNTIRTEPLSIGNWRFILGENTGRIFSTTLLNYIGLNKEEVKISYKVVKNTNWPDLKIQNFRIGLEISEAIAVAIANKK